MILTGVVVCAVGTVALTCKSLAQICHGEELWRQRTLEFEHDTPPAGVSMRHYYIGRCGASACAVYTHVNVIRAVKHSLVAFSTFFWP